MFTRDGLSHLWNEMVKDGELNHRLNMDINNRYMVTSSTVCLCDQGTEIFLIFILTWLYAVFVPVCIIINEFMLKLS